MNLDLALPLLLFLNHLKTSSSTGKIVHFVEGTCYEWSGIYSPHMSDNDWAKVLAYHGGEPRLVTDREAQHVAFQAVATSTHDGMTEVASKPTYLPALENPGIMVTWAITGVCG